MFEEMVERGKETQSVQLMLINMGKDNNSLSENNTYTCSLSGMFEEMMERGKEIQSVQHIHMGKNNNSRSENNMYICTLSGMFEDMVERREKDTISTTHTHTHYTRQLTVFFNLLDSSDTG